MKAKDIDRQKVKKMEESELIKIINVILDQVDDLENRVKDLEDNP